MEPCDKRVLNASLRVVAVGGFLRPAACQFGIVDTDVVMLLTRQRVAATIGVPAAAVETSQVQHYATGEWFAPHHDYLNPGWQTWRGTVSAS